MQDDLARHLQRALRISPDEVQALLWEHPRSLLLSVVPTALRRARSLWRPVSEDPGARPGDLLPEFITRALFDALNVPEVWFDLPYSTDQDESLPIERALREAVPGRVSRRYGYQHQSHRTWLPLPPEEAGGVLDLESVTLRYTREGTWTPARQGAADPGSVQVIRPHVLRLSTRQRRSPTSHRVSRSGERRSSRRRQALPRPTFQTPQRGPAPSPRSGSRPTRLEIRWRCAG